MYFSQRKTVQKVPQNRLTGVLLIAVLGASTLMAGCTLLGGQGNVTPAKTYLLHVAEESVALAAFSILGIVPIIFMKCFYGTMAYPKAEIN